MRILSKTEISSVPSIGGLFTDTTFSTYATLPNGNEGTWENIKAGYPSAFDGTKIISGPGTIMPSSIFTDFAGVFSIGEDITEVGSYAFNDCYTMTGIRFSTSVTQLNNNVAGDFTGYTEYWYSGSIEQWNAINKEPSWAGLIFEIITIHCVDGDATWDPFGSIEGGLLD